MKAIDYYGEEIDILKKDMVKALLKAKDEEEIAYLKACIKGEKVFSQKEFWHIEKGFLDIEGIKVATLRRHAADRHLSHD